MRELLYKNITSMDHKKRDVFVEEVVVRGGVLAKTTKRCLYFIKSSVPVNKPLDIEKLAKMKETGEEEKRHFHVLKEHDTEHNIDRLMCKVAGTFYAMVNNHLYSIVFIHTFKISFEASESSKA